MQDETPEQQAVAFVRSIYEAIAHGDDEHKKWLWEECQRWVKPLKRLIEENRTKK